jgi:hypothetical protein
VHGNHNAIVVGFIGDLRMKTKIVQVVIANLRSATEISITVGAEGYTKLRPILLTIRKDKLVRLAVSCRLIKTVLVELLLQRRFHRRRHSLSLVVG